VVVNFEGHKRRGSACNRRWSKPISKLSEYLRQNKIGPPAWNVSARCVLPGVKGNRPRGSRERRKRENLWQHCATAFKRLSPACGNATAPKRSLVENLRDRISTIAGRGAKILPCRIVLPPCESPRGPAKELAGWHCGLDPLAGRRTALLVDADITAELSDWQSHLQAFNHNGCRWRENGKNWIFLFAEMPREANPMLSQLPGGKRGLDHTGLALESSPEIESCCEQVQTSNE